MTSFIMGMGPRARRRAAWLGVVALVAIGIGAYYAASSVGHGSKNEPLPNMDLSISFGFTPKQVLARIGPPNSKRGTCWTYAAHKGVVSGIYAGPYTDAVRFCFANGIVSDVHDHEIAYTWRHQRVPAKWSLPMTFAPSYETTFQSQF